MAGATPAAPTTQTTGHVSAPAARWISLPSGLVPVAVLLAAAVGLVSLLPSLAQAVWEVPHLFVLGLVISYGVFSQRNTDVEATTTGLGDGDGGAKAWNARYRPDDPLVMVADHAAGDGSAREGAMERPLSLPVRRLKPPAATQEPDVAGEETDSSASSSGFWAGAHTAPSPPSVLDADLGLSPCSQPQLPPFFGHGSATTKSSGYYPCRPRDETLSEDGEETDDWDAEVDGSDDEMTVSSERSSLHGDVVTICANDQTDGDGDDDGTSVDEELFKLAWKAAPAEGEEEVDRKADEFIAKFREQIRRQ
jgi:hypothetical protein